MDIGALDGVFLCESVVVRLKRKDLAKLTGTIHVDLQKVSNEY